jgi:hypothetical protein
MGFTTIAVSVKVYKEILCDKHQMETKIGHPISFSVAVGILHRKWNKKLLKEDIEYAMENKKTV